MYQGSPCLPFFSSVVKNVASPNIEIKKLVYIYLLNHAEAEPDLALLSINTIQKSLSDGNPQVRALALKTMAGIRVPVISQIVSLAIKKGMGDMSPFVRKAAALAIPKCYRLDPGTLPQLLVYLSTLLGDRQYYVAGAAVAAFMEICPERINLIHKHYRGLVKKLVDMDEWSQLETLQLMTIYGRKCFPPKTVKLKKKNDTRGFYGDEEPNDAAEETSEEVMVLDPDLELLLKGVKPLLQSRNSAVVVATARIYLSLGTAPFIESTIGPLIALLRGPQDIQHIALYNIVSVAISRPDAFVRYASHFLLHSTDTPQVWELKLEILTLIFPHCANHLKSLILNELEHFASGSDRALVRESVRGIGRCAQSDARTASRCLRLLLKQIGSPDDNLVSEAVTVIRHLIQQDPDSHVGTVVRLAKGLDVTTSPKARATIIWLVGEFSGVGGEDNIAPDVLRLLAKNFADEAEPAKLQIVLLAAKVYLLYLNRLQLEAATNGLKPSSPFEAPEGQQEGFAAGRNAVDVHPDPANPVVLLWNYIFLLGRYDTSYDLRDRLRLYRSLLATPNSTELASLMLLAPKPVPQVPSPSESRKGFTLGSASLVIGNNIGDFGVKGYERLPDWVKSGEEPDARLRDVEEEQVYGEKIVKSVPAGDMLDRAIGSRAIVASATPPTQHDGKEKEKAKTLDDWLAEESQEDSESEEEDEEEDEDEETEEDDEDESEETDEEGETGRLVKGGR